MTDIKYEKPNPIAEMGKRFSKFFLNRYFLLSVFCGACIVTVLEKEVIGALIFASLICICLVLCDDIMTTVLPFLLMCVFLTRCYDSADTFIKFIWFAIPLAAAVIFHFIAYRKQFKFGESLWGLFAVAVAISLGGVSWVSGYEYFTPTALYYTFFLGIGMIIFYILLKSQLSAKRDYDVREKLVTFLYITGIFACFMILKHALPMVTLEGGIKLPYEFQPSNNLSTFIMFALPCPFLFVRKNKLHILAPFFMLLCLILTGSRAGVFLGLLEMFICLAVSAIWDKPRRFLYVCLSISIIGLFAIFCNRLSEMIYVADFEHLVDQDEKRMQLIDRAFDMMTKNPVFGHGLGYWGNFDIYKPKSGAMGWYHMMIPQIIGSLGIVGIIAYLFQAVMHVKIGICSIKKAVSEKRAVVITLLLSYVGVLLMSQVNPGLFCPLPYGLMAMVIFAVIDGDDCFGFILRAHRRRLEKKEEKLLAEAKNDAQNAEADEVDEPSVEEISENISAEKIEDSPAEENIEEKKEAHSEEAAEEKATPDTPIRIRAKAKRISKKQFEKGI